MIEKLKNIFKLQQETDVNINIEDKINKLFESLNSDIITIIVGNDLISYGNNVPDIVNDVRFEIKNKSGFIYPLVHVISSENLQENEIIFKVRDKKVLQKFIIPNQKSFKREIKSGLIEIYNKYLNEIFTCEITEKYINQVQKKCPWLIWNITSVYSITEIREVLVQVLEKEKSIKNICYIFEKFSEYTLDAEFYKHRAPNVIANKISTFL